MGLRPASCYRDIKQRAFTRTAVTVHDKNYVGAAPAVKIRQFNLGNPEYNFNTIVDLIVQESVVIRDNAIESVRTTINRFLQRKIGNDAYFMKIRVFPHHILRENKQAQGAGADRVSQGMRNAFGRAIGRAVRVKEGTVLISILVDEKHKGIAEQAFYRTAAKLPCKVRVFSHKEVGSIGTKPRKTKIVEEEKEEKLEEVEEEKEGTKEEDQGKEPIREKETEEKHDDEKAKTEEKKK